jgi:hypothetical protein
MKEQNGLSIYKKFNITLFLVLTLFYQPLSNKCLA